MKIYIVGSVGSGKTTIARKVAACLQIPHFETDNFVWTRNPKGDIRNDIDIRNQLFTKAVKQDEWVIEGVHIDWTDQALRLADHIIFLDIPVKQRAFRIIRRYIRQLLNLEKANYKPSFSIFRKMFQWNKYFEKQMKPLFLLKFKTFDGKVHYFRTNEEVDGWFRQLNADSSGSMKGKTYQS